MLTEPSPDRLNLWPRYVAHLRFVKRSPATIRATCLALRNLTDLAGDLADVTEDDVMAYLGRDDITAKTRSCYLARIRTFYVWAVKKRYLDTDPTLDIERPKVSKGLPKPIGHADLDRALREAPPRVRAWLMLGAYAGLRCAEAAGLHADNIRPPVLVITGKGDKTRAVPLHPVLAAELANWPAEGYLFPGAVDGHVSPKHVSQAVNSHLRRLGIRSTAHKARARFGTDIYRVSQDIVATQALLGHANIATTMAYVEADRPKLAAMVEALDYGKEVAS